MIAHDSKSNFCYQLFIYFIEGYPFDLDFNVALPNIKGSAFLILWCGNTRMEIYIFSCARNPERTR